MNFSRIDVSRGLPQNIVYDLVQDQSGFLWIATGQGLARYDGNAIQSFGIKDGMAEDFVTSIFQSRAGDIYAGHFKGGISKYANGKWSVLVKEENGSPVKSFAETTNGAVLFLRQLGGLFEIKEWSTQTLLSGRQDPVQFYSLTTGPDNKIYIGRSTGVVSATYRDSRLNDVHSVAPLEGMQVTALRSVAEGKALIVGTRSNGILFQNLEQEDKQYKIGEEGEVDKPIQCFGPFGDKGLLAGTKNGVLQLQQRSDGRWVQNRKINGSQGLDDPNIHAVLEDAEGNCWFGSFGSGLFQIPWNKMVKWDSILPNPNIRWIEPIGDEHYLLATPAGISRLSFPEKNGLREPFTRFVFDHFPSQTGVNCLLHKEGSVWVGTDGNGLLKLNTQSGKLSPFGKDPRLKDAIINHLSLDAKGQIWVATLSQGAFVLSTEGETLDQYSTANNLLHNDIYGIFHDRDGYAWFLTRGTGLAKLKDDMFTYYTREEGFYGLNYSGIAQDSVGGLWIGTAGNGLYHLHESNLTTYLEEDGLSSNYIYGLTHQNEALWLMSLQQLMSFDPATRDFQLHLDLRESPLFGFSQNVMASGPSNTLLLGSNQGLILTTTHNPVNKKQKGISVYLNEFLVSGTEMTPAEGMQLDYESYRIRFGFESLLLNRMSSPVQYQYYLEGYDKDWNEASSDPYAHYTGVLEGNYRLHVRAGQMDDLSGAPETVFSFSVATPFWRKTWFLFTCVALVILGFYSLVHFREVNLRKTNKLLETMVEERTSEIRKQNEEIEQFTYAISHDLKTPVYNISGLLEMLESSEGDKER